LDLFSGKGLEFEEEVREEDGFGLGFELFELTG
jgi:hypothetical protein